MKKILLTIAVLGLTASFAQAQFSVEREQVVLELFGGTWCVFCPGASLGADELVANEHEIAIIEYHVGDAYQNISSTTRDNYYNVSGYPTQVFDGTNQSSGGSATTSIYPSYIPAYDEAKAHLTPIDFGLNVERNGTDVTVKAEYMQVGEIPAGQNIVLHVATVESHIAENWFILTEINFVMRDMYPSAAGTPLALTLNQRDTIEMQLQLDPSWITDDMELVAFIQNADTKEMYNGRTVSLADQTVAVTNVDVVQMLPGLSETLCPGDAVEPSIKIANRGTSNLTQLDVEYTANGGSAQTLNWTGDLLPGFSTYVTLPALTYSPLTVGNSVDIVAKNPNGTTDEDMTDNMVSASWDHPEAMSGMHTLTIQPDFRGDEITWEVINVDGAVIASGGPYAFNDQTLITEQFAVGTEAGCHKFAIYDAGGTGLTTLFAGYYALTDAVGDTIAASLDGDFGSVDATNYQVNFATKIEELNPSLVHVFPNPSNGQFTVKMEEFAGQSVQLEIYQMNGTLLSSVKTSEGMFQFDLTNQPTGVYLLKVLTDQGQHLEKVSRL